MARNAGQVVQKAACQDSEEPLMGLLGGRLGVIADNAKWEMGRNAANRRKNTKWDIEMRHMLFICSVYPEALWAGS